MFVEKDGNYYLAGKDNKLVVLDSNYKEIGATLDVPGLNKYSYDLCCMAVNPFTAYSINNYLVVRVGERGLADHYYLDDNKNFVELEEGYDVKAFDNYLVISNEDNIIVYDKKMTKITEIESIDDYELEALYLNSVLVFGKSSSEYKFYNVNTGEELKTISTFRRIYSGYEVKFVLEKDGKGTLTISKDEEELGSLSDASFEAYITAPNNGITMTVNRIIYNASGDILVVEKNEL